METALSLRTYRKLAQNNVLTHHRGQVHAMLSGSSVAPPQLDEFVLTGDSRFRGDDLAALGWSEDELMR